MEFWGAEVKSGEPLRVSSGDGRVLHLSQACLGELKKEKGTETVYLFVNVDGKRLVLATLFTDKSPQQQFDLVFDRDFELSHNWKSGSVYFCGYKVNGPSEEDESPEEESDESESEEDIPLTIANNGKPELKPKKEKPSEAKKANAAKDKESDAGKQKVKIVEPNKDAKPEEDEESSDEDLMSEDGDEDDSEDEGDSDNSDDESVESDEETPKKAEPSKKRAAESATKTPVQQKKAKVTPQKSDGKKVGVHVATPHPAKQAGKTPANKPNQQTPKSGGSHTCKSCNRTFGSEKALESHSKAKHAGGK
ncbi:Histone deacetylase [Handroanthus impetiginosus]|uniref:Histone deacetylase n=1 Tax=Handroanthus impetiginosus TaxID=429701 RepID=A0A2G9GD25_9LAMI|nr:Histone deacetylase [Handroanthus impetiginosus]